MIVEPEKYVDEFREAGADIITFHYEATAHAHRCCSTFARSARKAGIAINPQRRSRCSSTSIEECDSC